MKNGLALAVLATGSLVTGFVGSGVVGASGEQDRSRAVVHVLSEDRSLNGKVVMVSVVKDGVVIAQQEMQIGAGPPLIPVPAGLYDLRAEGDGLVTQVKNGVHIHPGDNRLIFSMVAGEGARIIEYATGGITREEVAERLKKLEAEVTEIKKKIDDID